MKVLRKLLALSLVLSLVLVAGCSKDEKNAVAETKSNEVNVYMWGGSESVNRYMDDFVAVNLLEKEGIKLNRVPINNIADTIAKIELEKEEGIESGSVDVIWMNGENFKYLKTNDLLTKDIALQVENVKNIDITSDKIAYDFMEPIDNLEIPFGQAQFVFVYDSEMVKTPPKNFSELNQWIKDNPGKFTYPDANDFIGSAFIRQAMYHTTGGHEQYLNINNVEELGEKLDSFWAYLNYIEQYLYREGTTYPESSAKLDELFKNGEIYMTMNYNPLHASNMIKQGEFREEAKTFLLEEGTLSNTHYLAVPFNAPNEENAIKAINYLVSFEAQLEKFKPEVWGDGTILSFEKLSQTERNKLESVDRGEAVLEASNLEKHQLPEISSKYIEYIEEGWFENVAKK